MRISDWSSDVCSSDLRMDFMSVLLGIIVRYILVAGRGRWDDPIGHAPSIACLPVERLGDRNAPTIILNPQVGRELTEPGHRIEIGRASCRERVCQYV